MPDALMSTFAIADGAPAAMVSVTVELPFAGMDAGLSDAVTPAGKPLTDRPIVCAAPPLTETAKVVDEPAWTRRLDGAIAAEKSFAPITHLPCAFDHSDCTECP